MRTLEDERQEVLKNIDALDQEFAERRAVLDSDHEMLLNAVSQCVNCCEMITNVERQVFCFIQNRQRLDFNL